MSRTRPPIAVLLSRFPLITETFILREVIELERQGQPVVLVPMIRESPEVVHEEARPWMDRALFTPWVSKPILRALMRAFVKQTPTTFRLLGWIVGRAVLHPGTLVRSLLLFPKSVHLAEELAAAGVRHLHAHFATHPATMATIISALSGIPFSFTVHAHDIFVERALLRRKLADAQFVRAISDFNKRFLENLFPLEAGKKIRVVHVGVEPERYAPSRAGAAYVSAATKSPPRLLCIAALKPYKGVKFLVEACRLLKERGRDFRCDVIGTGPLRNAIRRAVDRAGLHDLVRLQGALPQHLVATEVQAADVFVLPSVIAADGQMEGIPVALMEAMAAEKPVVSTAISGIPELVQNNVSGLLVDPANPRSLADAIELLLLDADLRRRLGRAARETVEDAFDLRRCVAALLAILDGPDAAAGDDTSPFTPMAAEGARQDARGEGVGRERSR
jgi:colanic acid/amylovoran biosynthesis glycosyltransferase